MDISDAEIKASTVRDSVDGMEPVSLVVQDNTMHDVSQLHVAAFGEVGTSQDSIIQTVPIESIPSTVSSPADPLKPLHSSRIFLDICCGLNAPLSSAVSQLSGDIMQFDILIHSSDDLLDNQCYERLLRVCASGIVAYAGASPSCCEYSRLKLKPGGPPALRTPEFLQGLPDLNSMQLLKVQESNIMLERCIMCLRLVISSGGHGHLEQPSSAMSWQEPVVQQYLQQEACSCVSIAACGYDRDWCKTWMLASTFSDIERLAFLCPHPKGTHQQIAGALSPEGHFLSRDTAQYPPSLAKRFAELILPLLTTTGVSIALSNLDQYLPVKSLADPPFPRQDGGGFASQADWSAQHSYDDCFKTLRKNFFSHIMDQRLDRVIMGAFYNRSELPPFSMEQLAPFRRYLDEFLMAQGHMPDWSIPKDQNISLFVLQHLCLCMGDPDTALFPYLIEGVPLGINETIAPSKCFPLQPASHEFDPPLLSVHHTNWSSAEEDPEVVNELIQKEIDSGWVEQFHGTIEDAQQFFENGLAIGRLGLALSDSRPPRLVLDSTVCGVNPRCKVPEKSQLPTARDVLRSYPLRQSSKELSGVSFDVKSAHKQVAVHPKDRGYLCFQFQGKIFFYKNCPFGAVVSAHFWSRLGGVYQRLFHRLCFLPHAAFLYVDDLLWIQESTIIGLSAAVIAILCLLTGLPISWKKCELGSCIIWIGWSFHLGSGFVSLPESKRQKRLDLLTKLQTSSHCSRKSLEKFLGLALWVTQLWPEMRIWLHNVYRDLYSIPASQFSVDPSNWDQILTCLSDDLIFTSKPAQTAIPIQGHLIQVRHHSVSTKMDLQNCLISDKRIWLRIRDPNSSKRKLSAASIRILKMYFQWLENLSPVRSMWPKPVWQSLCVADAFAAGTKAGIGGAIFLPSGACTWFSLPLQHSDFKSLNIPIHDDLQKDIASLETLAQIALVFITIQQFPGARIPIKIPTLSDNTGAEAVSNKLFTTNLPLALFLEKLCLLISTSHVEVEVNHIPGRDNTYADALSRWTETGDPPCNFLLKDRFDIQLPTLWNLDRQPKLVPASAWIPWKLPGS